MKDDSDDNLEKSCATTSVNDTIVSDDDSAKVNKTLKTSSSPSCPSTDYSSYSGSDDETIIIESDQPLFSDTALPVNKVCGSNIARSNNCDPLLGCDVGVDGEDDAMMAEFLKDTFEANAVSCRNHHQASLAASTFGDVMDDREMDAFLDAENDAMMLLPDLCLES